MHEMCAAAAGGERARAEAIDAKLAALHKDLFVEPNPIPASGRCTRCAARRTDPPATDAARRGLPTTPCAQPCAPAGALA